jgi:hypothetical protein
MPKAKRNQAPRAVVVKAYSSRRERRKQERTEKKEAKKEARRKQERTEKKEAKKEAKSRQAKTFNKANLGTHFLRILSRELIDEGRDARMYCYKDGTPFTEETAREALQEIVADLPNFGVQIFTRDNKRVVEELSGLYGGIPGHIPGVIVAHARYELLMLDIGARGYTITLDKYNKPFLNRIYDNELHEFHNGLPLRRVVDISTLDSNLSTLAESSPLAPLVKEALSRGLSKFAALEEALTKFHEISAREHPL